MTPFSYFLRLLRFLFTLFYILPPKGSGNKGKGDAKETDDSTKTTLPSETTTSTTTTTSTSSVLEGECPESKRAGHDKTICYICSPPPPKQLPPFLKPSTLTCPEPTETHTSFTSNAPAKSITPTVAEVRGYWIDRLKKSELEAALKRFGLPTDGNVPELKERLTKFFDEVLDFNSSQNTPNPVGLESEQETQILDYAGLPPFDDSVKTSQTYPQPRVAFNPREERLSHVQHDGLGIVKEILDLPPSVDVRTVTRYLTELKMKDRKSAKTIANPPQANLTSSWFNNDPECYRTPLNTSHSVGANDLSQICNTVRKWNLRYDGGKDTVAFLERLEELVEAYGIDENQLLKALPELLKGNALLWFRNNKDYWRDFGDFLTAFQQHFLPPGYKRILADEIRNRSQGGNESFRSYTTALTTLMRRLGGFSLHDQLNHLYTNMRPEYKLTIRRESFDTIEGFVQLAESYENYLQERETYRPPPHPSQVSTQDTAYYPVNSSRRPFADSRKPDYRASPRKDSVNFTSSENTRSTNWTNSYRGRNFAGSRDYPNNDTRDRGQNVTSQFNRETRPEITCFNCEEKGHRFEDCRRPKVVRCYNCKKEGVRTVNCNCRSGNGRRGQERGGVLNLERSQRNPPPRAHR